MPKFNLTQAASTLLIKIDDVGNKQAELMGALQECAEGRCACPTSQYEKLQSVDIAAGPDTISVTLTPRTGESIDRRAIEKCLEYTAGQSGPLTGKK